MIYGMILAAILVVTPVTYSLAAGIFEWGAWGMSLAEVKALYGSAEPAETHVGDGEQHIYTYQMKMPAGEAYEMNYAFYPMGDKIKLCTVWYAFSFTVDTLKQHNAREAELVMALEAILKTRGEYKYAADKTEGGESSGYQHTQRYWLSDKECIVFAAYWYGGETLDGVNSNMDFDFYDMADPGTQTYLEVLEQVKWQTLK